MGFLRVQVLGVQAQESWRYYVLFQILDAGSTAAAVLPHRNAMQPGSAAALPADLMCRTDTARPSRTPEFSSRTFLLRLPTAGASHEPRSCTGGAQLAVSLFAAPSADAPAGPIVAGREVDRLVASAVLDLQEQLLLRLGTGERVVLPLLLHENPECRVQHMPGGLGSQAAQLQSLRSSQQAHFSGTKTHVLLELMLLQAEAPSLLGPRVHSSGQQASGVAAVGAADTSNMVLGSIFDSCDTPAGAGSQGSNRPAGIESKPGDTDLFVWVSAASNVPLVPGPDGQLEAASICVTAGVDAAGKVRSSTSSASTSAAEQTVNPSWGELLCLHCQEAELAQSRLQISLVSQSSHRAVARGCLRLSGLLPGQHYSIALAVTDHCMLYMTVVLGLGSSTLLAALQGAGLAAAAAAAGAGRLQLLQVGLPLLDRPMEDLLPRALQQQGAKFEVLAVWRNATGSTSGLQPQQQQGTPVYVTVDGRDGADAAGSVMLRAHNSNTGLLAVGGPSRAGSAASSSSRDAAGTAAGSGSSDSIKGLSGVLAVVPLHSPQQPVTSWPQGHQLVLPVLMMEHITIALELHAQLHPRSNSSKGASAKLPAAVCFAHMTIPLKAVAARPVGQSCRLSGLQFTLSQQAVSVAAADAAVTAGLQATRWDVPAYMQHLQQLSSQQQRLQQQQQQHGWHQQQLPELLGSHSPVPAGTCSSPHPQGSLASLGATAAADQESHVVQLLVGDVLAKQQALERVQRQLDLAGQCAEAADSRVAELQAANSTLSADLQHLRQLLHEEKGASAAAAGLLDSTQPHLLPGTNIPLATATREQVLQQLTVVLGKHGTERARNGELVRRLQQLHAEKVDVMELYRQYLELQEAHFQQSKLIVDQDIHRNTLTTLKQAVTDQEALITRLQQLLAAAAARNKELEVWKASANALQKEVDKLRDGLESTCAAGEAAEQQALQQAAAQAAAAAAAAAALTDSKAVAQQAAATFEARLINKESERLAAVMKAEKAEGCAVAAQNELLEVTKRSAREIAQLKTRLAEKDAQLLGGFGSIDHLTLDHSEPIPPTAAAAIAGYSPGAFSPGILNNSVIPGAAQGHPAFPGWQGASSAPVWELPTAAQALAPGQLHSNSRGASGGNTPGPAAATPGRVAAKLPDALHPCTSSQRSANSPATSAQSNHISKTVLAGQLSGTLRAGSAEARLIHQRDSGASSHPGSPLLPTSLQQQQRLTTSADGARSTAVRAAAVGSSSGSSRANQDQQRRAAGNAATPQQAWTGNSLQQQRWVQGMPNGQAFSDDGEGDCEDVLNEDEDEEEGVAVSSEPPGRQQQQQQQVTSSRKRGGFAGLFFRG